jgi:hypothetical protein
MSFQVKKPIQNNHQLSLYDTLHYSYQPLKEQKNFYKDKGYYLDKKLSNDNQQVLYNPTSKKLLYNIAGTHNLKDWGTDAYLLFGKIKDTNRYKEAEETLKQAKQKYGLNNATITGHSLGATLGNYIAKPQDKSFLLDEGATFGQKIRNNDNFKHYRTQGDLVSVLTDGQSNQTTLRNKNWLKDPLTAHHVENIKNEKIFI